MTIVLNGTTGITTPTTSSTGEFVTSVTGFKNRIINGAMVIDQRYAGASFTQTTATDTVVDRFFVQGSITSKFTAQQSSTTTTGFNNSFLLTSSAATTPSASDYYYFGQKIEGLNVYDLAWGTASAATVTLSFWVRSSLTGTFSGALLNSAANRSYAFTYTIVTIDDISHLLPHLVESVRCPLQAKQGRFGSLCWLHLLVCLHYQISEK